VTPLPNDDIPGFWSKLPGYGRLRFDDIASTAFARYGAVTMGRTAYLLAWRCPELREWCLSYGMGEDDGVSLHLLSLI
jgi:hypothetical protein